MKDLWCKAWERLLHWHAVGCAHFCA